MPTFCQDVPKYFVLSACGDWQPFSITGGQVSLCIVKVTWIRLLSFVLILHFFSHTLILFKFYCRFCEAIVGLLREGRTGNGCAYVITSISGNYC